VNAPPLPYRRKNYLIRHYDHEVMTTGTKMVSLLRSSPPDKGKKKNVKVNAKVKTGENSQVIFFTYKYDEFQ